jgi:hypothetical protein|tara:strand:+ start:33282 stop:33533 length:252 start_codon:yes stop_codon:yes gene_type:complete
MSISQTTFTTDQKAAEEARVVAKNALPATKLKVWERKMQAADVSMPRSTEDVISSFSDDQKAALPAYTRDAYAAKVTLRGQKP